MVSSIRYRTNNWSDYGGMDVYVSQITGTQNHDYFYTNANVIVCPRSHAKHGSRLTYTSLVGCIQELHTNFR